jgi:hypothetical protein
MTVPVRILAAAALAFVAAFAGWRGAQLPNPHRGPRMVPWRFLMVLAAAAAIVTATGGIGR